MGVAADDLNTSSPHSPPPADVSPDECHPSKLDPNYESEMTGDISFYTVDSAIEFIGLGRFQFVVIALAGLCWTAESMEMLLLSFIKSPLQCEWGISDARAALITTSVAIGMFTGATCWGFFADRFGRRTSFLLSSAFCFVFGLISASSVNYYMMLLSRGMVGFGVGGVPVAFSLLMEFLPMSKRGAWGMSLALFWAIGAIFEAAVAMFVLPKFGWRWLIIASTLPLFLVVVFGLWLSESPRWLISHGYVDHAQAVLERVARVNGRSMPVGRLSAAELHASDISGDVELANRESLLTSDSPSFPPNVVAQTPPTDTTDPAGRDVSTADAEDSALNGEIPPEAGAQPPRRSRPPPATLASLLPPGARVLAINLAFIWFISAFVYYGLVMLQPEAIAAENEGRRCHYMMSTCGALEKEPVCGGNEFCSWSSANATCVPTGTAREVQTSQAAACARKLSAEDFMATLWASVGEFAGVLLAFSVVDRIGRRPLIGYLLSLLVAAFVVLLGCAGRTVETSMFFLARGGSAGSFQAIYLFTNEVYPSSIRASAMGIASSVSRTGLIITPFVAQYFFNLNEKLAVMTYVVAGCTAVLCTILVPIETTGRSFVSSMEELVMVLKQGNAGRDVTFANDPAANPFWRFLRWRARVDGGTRQ